MTIYRIHPDRLRYKLVTIPIEQFEDKQDEDYSFILDSTPKTYLDTWTPLNIEFYDSTEVGAASRLPDLIVDDGRLFLTSRAYDLLHELLAPHGEFLPVTYTDGEGYLFNVLAVADSENGLDHKLCIKSEYGDLESLAFHEEQVKDMPVFRCEFDQYMGIFCPDEFKARVEQAGLQGVTFGVDLGNIFPPDPSAQGPITH